MHQRKNASFQSFVSDPVKWDPILDQFSMITRPYPRLNGLKTIPSPAAHTRIADTWEYPPPPGDNVKRIYTLRTHTDKLTGAGRANLL